MPRHHYIPVSVLRTFASRDAWKVVKAPGDIKRKIALSDKNSINHGPVRNWPVVVYEKGTKRLTRKVIGQVCSAPQLYRVPDYNDQLIRAIVRLNLREDPYARIPGFNFEALMKLGTEPLDPEWIERKSIAKLDGNFALLLPSLNRGHPLTNEQITTLVRFVVFARFRTPLWRRRYFQEKYGHRVRSFKEQVQFLSKMGDLPEESRASLERFKAVIDEHAYHVAMMRHSDNSFDPMAAMEQSKAKVKIKVKVLHSTSSVPFVTCDNPARPYKPNRLQEIFDRRVPGLEHPRVHILYPISPLRCIVISSNPSWQDFVHQSASVSSVEAINTALAIMADEQIVFGGSNVSAFQKWLRLDEIRPLARP